VTLQPRDRRALTMLGVMAVLVLIWRLMSSEDKQVAVVGAADSVPLAEKRLAKLRQTAAAVPGREKVLAEVRQELAEREKGVIQAETVQQAQAQILQIVRRQLKAQAPPIDMRSSEIGPVKALDTNYGEATVSVSFDCRAEQFVNLLADLANEKQLIATSEVRIGNTNQKEKVMPVRLTISGVVRRDLIPKEKGVTTF
jgi:hypothetical protein